VLGKKYEIVITEEVQRTLAKLPEKVRAGLMKEFDRIARNPYSGDRVEIECEHCPLDHEEEEDETHSPGETAND